MSLAPGDEPIDDGGGSGGSGSGSGGGGSSPPPPASNPSSVAANPALVTSTGGLTGSDSFLLIPCYDAQHKTFIIGTFDYTDFNTELEARYDFRQEEPQRGRKLTISRVRLVYRDIGKAKITIFISCADSKDNKSKEIKIGSDSATGKIITAYFDFVCTGERPQAILYRKEFNGPLAIISVDLVTNQEIAEQV